MAHLQSSNRGRSIFWILISCNPKLLQYQEVRPWAWMPKCSLTCLNSDIQLCRLCFKTSWPAIITLSDKFLSEQWFLHQPVQSVCSQHYLKLQFCSRCYKFLHLSLLPHANPVTLTFLLTSDLYFLINSVPTLASVQKPVIWAPVVKRQ